VCWLYDIKWNVKTIFSDDWERWDWTQLWPVLSYGLFMWIDKHNKICENWDSLDHDRKFTYILWDIMLCHPLKFSCLAYFLTLKMKVTCSSEPWVNSHWTALHYILEGKRHHNDCHENLWSAWWLTVTVWCGNAHVIWWIGPKFLSLHPPPSAALKSKVAGSFKMRIPVYQTKGITFKKTVIFNKMCFEICCLLQFNGMLAYSMTLKCTQYLPVQCW
jgi:hypothetical protein